MCRSSWSHGWSRPGRAGGRSTSWTPPTSCSAVPGLRVVRVAAVRAGGLGCKRYNVLGALDAVTHRLIRVTNHDSINAESGAAPLWRRRKLPWGCRSRWCWDNAARYQKRALVQTLAASLGIELLYLPSYSPNLNLIERLWRFVARSR